MPSQPVVFDWHRSTLRVFANYVLYSILESLYKCNKDLCSIIKTPRVAPKYFEFIWNSTLKKKDNSYIISIEIRYTYPENIPDAFRVI